MAKTASNRSPAELEALISATRLRLRMHSPFFAALAMFAEVRFTSSVEIAGTDGQTLWFHPQTYGDLAAEERDAVFLHELLHAALLHSLRRGVRDPQLFNIAADIVVNGMVAAEGSVRLPSGGLRDTQLEHHSVEEIYELLQKQAKRDRPKLPLADLLSQPPDSPAPSPSDSSIPRPTNANDSAIALDAAPHDRNELNNLHDRQALEAHWKQAIQQAQIVASSQGQGSLPAGLSRHLDEIANPQLDWRSQLWRYLVHTPSDYAGFDRRFISQGLYLDQLEGESVEVFCCIDTSGSVGSEELALFMGELQGILSAYPLLRCWLWYADADCYGPYELTDGAEIPEPEGGGGTDFCPFFAAVSETWSRDKEALCVYLTDGYGDFPPEPPELPTLWVVIPGGKSSEEFPFGEVVRLRQS